MVNKYIIIVFISLFFCLSVSSGADLPKKIIIDPQFGGNESGPIGRFSKAYAKDITLAIALKLGRRIEERTDFHVVYTRKTDEYISFEQRISKVNESGGEIFLSIGVNWSKNSSERGVELFNAYCNFIDEYKHNSSGDDSEKLIQIIEDLKMETIHRYDKGIELSNMIYSNLENSAIIKAKDIKLAPFDILTGVNMPSALVMIGFMSNEQDEKAFRNSTFHNEIVEVLFTGLQKYFRKYEKNVRDVNKKYEGNSGNILNFFM